MTLSAAPIVYLLDDEPGLVKALTRLLTAEGFDTRGYTDAAALRAAIVPGQIHCLILDVAMPGLGGLELQQQFARLGPSLPIVFLTGHGDIPMSVQAIQAGAVDFLTKPVDAALLIRAVRTALQRATDQRAHDAERTAIRTHYRQLTPREREVLHHVVSGKPNKQIASLLGTGEQNIKIHRSRVMAKMHATSLPELVRLAAKLPSPDSPENHT
jgi:FixJ family two-component response regulator